MDVLCTVAAEKVLEPLPGPEKVSNNVLAFSAENEARVVQVR